MLPLLNGLFVEEFVKKGLKRRLRLFVWLIFSQLYLLQPAVAYSEFRHEPDGFWKGIVEKSELDGFIKNESSLRARIPLEFTKAENTLQLELTHHLLSQIDLFANIRVFYDAVWDLEDDFNREGRKDLATDFDLREAYLDIFFDWADLRIGRQQVVWGEADGLKTLDVVNPQDFKEFILDDFEDSRIPLWMIKIDTYLKDYTLQFIWIPDLRFNELKRGSEFDFFRPPPPPGIKVVEKPPVEPAKTIKNHEWGLRLSWKKWGWDFTLNYFYNYEDFPTVFQELSFDPISQQPALTLKPRHTRFHILGGTFAKPLGAIVLRGEITYNLNKYFRSKDPTDRDGVKKRDLLNYVLALDYDVPRYHLFLSSQLFQRIIFYQPGKLINDQIESVWSFFGKMDFFNETLLIDSLILYGINDAQALFRINIAYDLTDTWRITLGADFFEGEREEFFGQFDSRDRFNFKIEYNF